MEKIKVKRELKSKVEMPTTIIVGDPIYFEEYPNRKDLVYDKGFRGKKDWVGIVTLSETETEYKDMIIEGSSLKVVYAPNEEFARVYLDDMKYKSQNIKNTQIGVDSARYLIQIDDKCHEINTGGDGYWGDISEFYRGDKLEGIMIDMELGDIYSFNDHREIIEYLFNIKF